MGRSAQKLPSRTRAIRPRPPLMKGADSLTYLELTSSTKSTFSKYKDKEISDPASPTAVSGVQLRHASISSASDGLQELKAHDSKTDLASVIFKDSGNTGAPDSATSYYFQRIDRLPASLSIPIASSATQTTAKRFSSENRNFKPKIQRIQEQVSQGLLQQPQVMPLDPDAIPAVSSSLQSSAYVVSEDLPSIQCEEFRGIIPSDVWEMPLMPQTAKQEHQISSILFSDAFTTAEANNDRSIAESDL